MNKFSYIYILGNTRPTLYIGVTNNLIRRIDEHKQEVADGFTKKYHIKKLLYYEVFDNIEFAILREKELKHWKREWKLDLIRKFNPQFKDLYNDILY